MGQSTPGLANRLHVMAAIAHAPHLLEYAMLLTTKAGSGFRMNDAQGPGSKRAHARGASSRNDIKNSWALMFMLRPPLG